MFGSKLTDEKNTIIIDEDIFEGLDDFLDFPIEDDGVGKFNSIERSSSLEQPLPDVLIDFTDQKFIPQITNDLHIPYEELPPIDWIPKFPDFEAIDENLITFNNYDNNSDDTIFENKNDIVKIENSNVYNDDDDDDVIYQSKSPSSVLDLGSSNFYSAEKTETYAKRKRSRSRGRGVNQRVSSLSSDNSSEESHPVVAKEKKKKTIRKCLHCEITETPQWRAGPDGPKTLCNACGVRFKSGRLCAEYRPAASPTFVPSKHSNSHKKVLEMRRRCKEFQNPEFTPMRQAFV